MTYLNPPRGGTRATSYAIRLDYPPSINTYWRRAGNRIYLSKSGRHYKHSTAEYCLERFGKVPPLAGRLGVQLELSAPNERRNSDIDNRIKAVLDALEGVLYDNDSQVDQLIVKRLPVAKPGHVDVIVSEL